jgi:hypothetical protein
VSATQLSCYTTMYEQLALFVYKLVMKRSQRQAQPRFRSVCEYVYATTPAADITPFLLEIVRARGGEWSEPMTGEQFIANLRATAQAVAAAKQQ